LKDLKSLISNSNDNPVNLIVEFFAKGRLENEEHARYLINLYNKKFEVSIGLEYLS
jgi:hypothetical protein